jgi:hypothetical protein
MVTLGDIVFDCERPAALARFWAAVLEGYAVRPYDDAEIARLKAMGVGDVEDDPSVCIDSSRGEPTMFFQKVPKAKTVKNRVHLDLKSADRAGERERIIALGGRVIGEFETWTVFADPEGNEFCVADVPEA